VLVCVLSNNRGIITEEQLISIGDNPSVISSGSCLEYFPICTSDGAIHAVSLNLGLDWLLKSVGFRAPTNVQ
jgi:hypothetical protein